MIEDDVLNKFYRAMTPFNDIIHTLGLLHTARAKDVGFAKKMLSKAFKQSTPDYCAILTFESSLKGRPVMVFKIIKSGKRDMSKYTDKFLSRMNMEYNPEKDATQCVVFLKNKKDAAEKVANVKKNLFLAASFTGYRYILSYDLGREKQTLWSRKFRGSSKYSDKN